MMIKTEKARNILRTLPFYTLVLIFAFFLNGTPVNAAAHIDEAEYDGKGKVEIEFTSKVKYKNLKVTVKNSKNKTQKVSIVDKDDDDLKFKIVNYKAGETYSYKIKGVYKKGEKTSSTLSGKITIPKSYGSVAVEEVEYDSSDKEVEFEFATDVKWKSAKVKITSGGKNYVRYIEDKDEDGIEVKVKKLEKGKTYQYSISGIKKKGGKSFGTITGSFRA